jgi:hypothetical protein
MDQRQKVIRFGRGCDEIVDDAGRSMANAARKLGVAAAVRSRWDGR